jgi:hypothetical protein
MSSFEKLAFYRGLSKNYEISQPTVHATRKNRLPRDMQQHIHEAADNWFFLSSNINIVSAYAATPDHIARVIPLGPYKYCWSSQITDLLEICMHATDVNIFRDELANSRYKEEGLADAHRLGHEVMLFCDSYVCVPINCQINKHE